ncbi:SDR family oxidoreductase [Nostoc ellipsosporum NOK]|nr:SDR family oxidoreductase [Nostoc ellipsosporum NOK]
MRKLENKTALVTGGTSGIGKAAAADFIANGAKVIITGRYRETVDQTVAALGEKSHGIVSDAGKKNDLFQLREQVKAIHPTLDILYVNAGIGKYAPIEMIDEEHFDELFNIIVKGTLFTVQQLLPLMKRGSVIILNTSIVTEIGMPNSAIYSAAKAAVQSFLKTFAAELAPKGIRINAVSPGPISTNYFQRSNLTAEQYEQFTRSFAPQVPLARFGQPEEVAKVISFLASDDSSFMHGSEVFVDGGFPKIRVS